MLLWSLASPCVDKSTLPERRPGNNDKHPTNFAKQHFIPGRTTCSDRKNACGFAKPQAFKKHG
jgi:hypothetical protein